MDKTVQDLQWGRLFGPFRLPGFCFFASLDSIEQLIASLRLKATRPFWPNDRVSMRLTVELPPPQCL